MRRKHSEVIVTKVIARLKEIRLEKALSHEKLAQLAGITRPAISFIESGKRIPSILICFQIAHALEVSLGDVIKEAERESP